MKTDNNWGINFPKNPYDGQVFYYPHTKDTFTYIVPKIQSGTGEWLLITYQDFSNSF
tara:strand:+ start:329 stop:499 length:171 start_codon:yes stop_codon:yes gene_type:complete